MHGCRNLFECTLLMETPVKKLKAAKQTNISHYFNWAERSGSDLVSEVNIKQEPEISIPPPPPPPSSFDYPSDVYI